MHILIWILWLVALALVVPKLLILLGLEQENFRGRIIPTGFGLYLLFAAGPATAYLAGRNPDVPDYRAFLLVIVGFGLLGFLDDLFGSRQDSGLTGHAHAALRGRLTTGFLKAAGGLVISGLASALILWHGFPRSVLDCLVIALSANALNLLDLRPGRASAAFLLCAALLIVITRDPIITIGLLAIIVPLMYTYSLDSRGEAMLGDTGSNLLGGALGLAFVLVSSAYAELAILFGLVTLHILAERRSLTRMIEDIPLLKRIDSWTGVR